MIYKIKLLSDETPDFARIYRISPEAKFYDLHKIIQQTCGYVEHPMNEFRICTRDWETKYEVTLTEREHLSEEDSYLMEDTTIEELLTKEKQKLTYLFDPEDERVFYMQLAEIMSHKEAASPKCTSNKGEAPIQFIIHEAAAEPTEEEKKKAAEEAARAKTEEAAMGEEFYGDSQYNDEDIDADGYEMNDGEEK